MAYAGRAPTGTTGLRVRFVSLREVTTPMITLTRLNGQRFVVNAELIRTVESLPDTTVKLINGDTLIVLESMEDVVERAIEYGRNLRKLLPPS